MQASGIVVNVSGQLVKFDISVIAGAAPQKFKLGPGETAEIAPGYATRPESSPGTEPRPSVIETRTNAKVLPIEDPRAREFVTPAMREELADRVLAAPAPRVKRKNRKKTAEDDADIGDLDEVQE